MKLKISLAFLLIMTSPSFAVDFNQPILDMDGKPVLDCPPQQDPKTPKCTTVMTLARLSATALFLPDRDAQTETPDQKVKDSALAFKVYSGGDVKLTAEEVARIKQKIGSLYPPLTVYRAWQLLDPASVPKVSP